jgi:intein/homing endonuclease
MAYNSYCTKYRAKILRNGRSFIGTMNHDVYVVNDVRKTGINQNNGTFLY